MAIVMAPPAVVAAAATETPTTTVAPASFRPTNVRATTTTNLRA